MQDALGVRGGQANADLAGHRELLARRQSVNPPENGAQIFAIDVLHRDESATGGRVDVNVMQAADVWMGNLARHAHIAQ